MRFFILHADTDKAAAEDLLGYLKTRGPMPELDNGSRTRFLQPSDVLIVLWSQRSVFSPYRMQMEKRMLDAWADQQLVLVTLDHSFLPVGLRDLPVIDASFESGRALSVWPKVERQAKEAMNAALVARQQTQEQAPKGGSGSDDGPPARPRALEEGIRPAPSIGDKPGLGAIRVEPDSPAEIQAKSGGSSLPAFMFVAALGTIAWLGWEAYGGWQANEVIPAWVIGAGIGGGVLLLVSLVLLAWPKSKPKRSAAPKVKLSDDALAMVAKPAPVVAPVLFVSYAHADDDKVSPVVKVVEASGRTVWIDKGGIQAGEGWAGEIVRGIKGAASVMVMCSPKAFESDHIKREVYLADRYKKPMLPVFVEEAAPPEDFEYFFAGVQWLELFKLPEDERAGAVTKALAGV